MEKEEEEVDAKKVSCGGEGKGQDVWIRQDRVRVGQEWYVWDEDRGEVRKEEGRGESERKGGELGRMEVDGT